MSPYENGLVMLLLQTLIVTVSADNRAGAALTRKLLRNYERVPPPNGPTSVEIGIFINYFFALSEQTMDYSLSMYIRQQWYDPRLRFNRSENNNSTKLKLHDGAWNQIWVPDIYFRNEKRAITHYITRPNRMLRVHDDGIIWYVMKVTAYLMCPMKLHYYPLDTQGCPMRLESFDYDQRIMLYKWFEPKEKAVQFDSGVRELPHMDVSDFLLHDCSYNDTQAYPPGAYPCLEVEFIVKRDIAYYLMQFYIPSGMLVMLSWSSFWISVDAVVARVNIGLMIVLALTNQSIEARKELPRVSYIKAIDVWTSTCLVFAFSSLIEFALVNIRSRRDAQRARTKMSIANSAAASTSTPAATTATTAFGGSAPATAALAANSAPSPGGGRRIASSARNAAKGSAIGRLAALTIEPASLTKELSSSMLELPDPGRRMLQLPDPGRRSSFNLHRQIASVQQQRANYIDRLARSMFPLSFLLFNVVYWLSYAL